MSGSKYWYSISRWHCNLAGPSYRCVEPLHLERVPSDRCDNPLRAHKTLDFGLGPVHGFVDRLLLLSALGYHLGHGRLRVDLSPDVKRRRITGDARDHVVTRRIPIVGSLGRAFLRPGREVEPALERRNIEPNTGSNKLFLYLSS